jgi:hypothetical protein
MGYKCAFLLLAMKFALDIGTVVAISYQLDPIQIVQESLQMPDVCQPSQAVCLSNVRDLLRFARSSFWSDVAALCFLTISIITDVILVPAILSSKVVANAPTGDATIYDDCCVLCTGAISLGCNAVVFCILIANGYLWNGILQYSAQINEVIISSLHEASLYGIAPLVLGFVIGCPAAIAACALMVITNKN